MRVREGSLRSSRYALSGGSVVLQLLLFGVSLRHRMSSLAQDSFISRT